MGRARRRVSTKLYLTPGAWQIFNAKFFSRNAPASCTLIACYTCPTGLRAAQALAPALPAHLESAIIHFAAGADMEAISAGRLGIPKTHDAIVLGDEAIPPLSPSRRALPRHPDV